MEGRQYMCHEVEVPTALWQSKKVATSDPLRPHGCVLRLLVVCTGLAIPAGIRMVGA